VNALALNIGDLTARVRLVVPVVESDGRGGENETGVLGLTPEYAWASVEPLASREVLQIGQQKGAISHRCRMHFHPGVTLRSRVLWQGRTFEVVSVINRGEARRELELLLTERTVVTGGTA
jgi:SPP1 family predicted phage head-tail adaptor